VRGFGSFRIKLHRPNPLNLSFSPLGRRDAACTLRRRLTARKGSPGDWHIRPYGLNEPAKKLISRVAPWHGTSKKGTVRSQISFGSFRQLGANDDSAFGRP
jgi:hypothetical protein